MPEYIKLCMSTWPFPFIKLNYNNLHDYTDIRIEPLSKYTLPQIADYIRVHVLRDQGGYWLDADTIILSDKLPAANMIGDPISRTQSIGYLFTEAHSEMFEKWARYQDNIVGVSRDTTWSILGNSFTDKYIVEHPEITIMPITNSYPETYMIKGNGSRYEKYQEFYFQKAYHIADLKPTNMLMLHNSWTPDWYKQLSADEICRNDCTLSNILNEII